MKTFLLIGIMVLSAVGLLNAQSVPPVVINEVVYDPVGSDNTEGDETTYEWIELKNVSAAPQDISSWEIRASTYYPLSALTAPVPVGGFVIIYEGIGDDTNVDFGIGNIASLYMDKTGSQLGNSSGDLALYNSTSNTKDTIVDYFAYGAPSTSTNHTHAVDAGIWTPNDFVDTSSASEGYSIEYDGEGDLSSDYFIQQNPTKGLDNALPVSLSYFEARYSDNVVILRWITESETNNLGFEVYRAESKDGPFKKINPHRIAGAGTTASQHKYEYIDDTAVAGNQYFYYIENIDFSGEKDRSGTIQAMSGPFGKEKPRMFSKPSVLGPPVKFQVFQNFPNPFNPETWIPFQLPESADVIVKIYNVFGQVVRTIDVGQKGIGRYLSKDEAIPWDGRNQNGELVPSGVYFYQVRAGKFMAMKKMLLVK
ncbi:T9SS type A sorting domain-containing protein [Candidatus Poribacteria bacterium]|nr:T9SS type A sorting domain-containing protein [Candidatus Poribacteria bacterium]